MRWPVSADAAVTAVLSIAAVVAVGVFSTASIYCTSGFCTLLLLLPLAAASISLSAVAAGLLEIGCALVDAVVGEVHGGMLQAGLAAAVLLAGKAHQACGMRTAAGPDVSCLR